MLTEEQDAPLDSSPTTERSVEEVVQPNPDVQGNSSPENGETSSQLEESSDADFNQTVERLEKGETPLQATKKSEAQPAQKDERAENPKDNALSQEQEQALNKNFAERPEWKKVLDAAPPEKKGEVRNAMRTLYERENALNAQVEKSKPQLQAFERFKRGVGNDDQAVENTLALIELHQKGDPKALEMLDLLRNDLLQRTGSVLTSPDLLKRQKDNSAMLEQGLIDDAELAQRNKDLLEIQKSRVSQSQLQERQKQTEQEQLQRTVQAQQEELNNTCNDWEKNITASDPDYPVLRTLVADRAFKIGNERQAQLQGKRLLNGAEMKQVLDDALQQVKAETGKLLPKPKTRMALNGTSSSATSRRQPANEEEAFFQQVEELEARRR